MKEPPKQCQGCSYRRTCDYNHKTCPYLSTNRCTLNEYQNNYLWKTDDL